MTEPSCKKLHQEPKYTIDNVENLLAENRKNFKENMEKEKDREHLAFKKAHEHIILKG